MTSTASTQHFLYCLRLDAWSAEVRVESRDGADAWQPHATYRLARTVDEDRWSAFPQRALRDLSGGDTPHATRLAEEQLDGHLAAVEQLGLWTQEREQLDREAEA